MAEKLKKEIGCAYDGEDMYTGYKKAVEELTVGDIENFVDKLIKSENRFEILMLPE